MTTEAGLQAARHSAQRPYSADLNQVGAAAAELHVDLNDEDSVAALDDFLAAQFGVTGNPVETYIGLGKERLEAFNEITGDGFEDFLRGQLEELVEIAEVTRRAVDEGRAPPPRLLYTREELRELRKLQGSAIAERNDLGPARAHRGRA